MTMFEVVIASQWVGAKRRPMTGSSKQSIASLGERWIASSQVLLAMTGIESVLSQREMN
jgi:hypothetical protein